MRVRIAAAAAAVVLLGCLMPATPALAVDTVYTGLLRVEAGPRVLLVDTSGTHHMLVAVPYGPGRYLEDSTGRWREIVMPGAPGDMAMDPQGHLWVFDASGIVSDNTSGVWAQEQVALSDGDCSASASNASLAIAADGTIHAAWNAWLSPTVCYRERSNGAWGPVRHFATASPYNIVWSVDVALDGDTPHIVVGGDRGVVDITVSDTPAVASIGPFTGMARIESSPEGGLEGTTANGDTLWYLRFLDGSWSAERVADGNILDPQITRGPAGPTLFFNDGRQLEGLGIQRADRTATGWTTSVVTSGADGAPRGVFDPGGNLHLAFGRAPGPGQEWGGTYLRAPDPIAPTVTSIRVKPTTGAVMGRTIPVTVSWVGYDNLSGYDTSVVAQQTNGAWTTIATAATARSVRRSLAPGTTTYAFRVRGTDKAGNRSAPVTGPTVTVSRYQQSSTVVHYGGTWGTARSTAYSGGSARYARSASASVTVTFTGRSFAWVGAYGSTRGSAKVIVDGVWITTVNLNRSAASYRRIAWSTSWDSPSKHTVTIKPMGTAGHARIDADAFLVIR